MDKYQLDLLELLDIYHNRMLDYISCRADGLMGIMVDTDRYAKLYREALSAYDTTLEYLKNKTTINDDE